MVTCSSMSDITFKKILDTSISNFICRKDMLIDMYCRAPQKLQGKCGTGEGGIWKRLKETHVRVEE